MKPHILSIGISLFVNFGYIACNGQDTTHKASLNFIANLGYQNFSSNPQAPSKFTALNMRIGGMISYPISRHFEAASGILLGLRFKRNAENTAQGYPIPPPFLLLDEVASTRNHYFFSIPLVGVYKLQNPKIEMKAGINYTFYFANDKSVTFLTNRGELGLFVGTSLPLRNRLSLAIEYIHGLTDLYSSEGTVDGIDYSLSVRHRLLSAGIHYRLTK
jgi:Outer membrane protein beta-barrel domain